ncbi:uncharacterized protein BcabD6B2_15880 [Babesia caballi]|uniref:RanBP2-type domain-containing protein n=1 Tax=Babesia caballi TaxID=5871 RepID=A0AAV4LQB2_BABCB|nr:hypothetical protein, conserved [Babesia caballi]
MSEGVAHTTRGRHRSSSYDSREESRRYRSDVTRPKEHRREGRRRYSSRGRSPSTGSDTSVRAGSRSRVGVDSRTDRERSRRARRSHYVGDDDRGYGRSRVKRRRSLSDERGHSRGRDRERRRSSDRRRRSRDRHSERREESGRGRAVKDKEEGAEGIYNAIGNQPDNTAVDAAAGVGTTQHAVDTTALLKSALGDRTDINVATLNNEFRELNYSKAYGIDITGFVGVQPDVLTVVIPTESKPLTNYERRKHRKEEILQHPERFWKCNKCEFMNYLSNYECTVCQHLRNANR